MPEHSKQVHSRLLNNIEGRKLLEKHFPQKKMEVCGSVKIEHNRKRCVLPLGHDGEHNYVVDLGHDKKKRK